jgi:protein TonB
VSIPVVNIRKGHSSNAAEHYADDFKKFITSEEPKTPSEISATWDDLVFEQRNQEYGAYVLRKHYVPNLYKGFLITVMLIFATIFSPALVKLFKGTEPVNTVVPRKLGYSELSAPPPIDKLKPPPPQIKIPRLQKVIKFVPPKVVKEQVTEEVPTIKELKEHESAADAVEGTDVVFDEPAPEIVEDENEIFTVVEQQPEFAGGYEAMMNFIRKNMVYPASARRMGIDGTVHVSFLVSKTGTISEAKILRGISPDCDAEAIRVINLMPPWKPGMQNGKPAYVRFIMPLKFRLH